MLLQISLYLMFHHRIGLGTYGPLDAAGLQPSSALASLVNSEDWNDEICSLPTSGETHIPYPYQGVCGFPDVGRLQMPIISLYPKMKLIT